MILLTLAAFAQAAAPATHPRDTAMTCAAAVAVSGGAATTRIVAQASYHAMVAARIDRQGKAYTDRYQELMGQLVDYARPLVPGGAMNGQAPRIASDCDRNYPLARSTAPARLPTDPFERDLMCLGTVSFLEGVSRESQPGGAPTRDEIVSAQQAYIALLPDSRTQAAGLPDTAAVTARVGELLDRSIDFGNTEMVTRACIAALR